MIRALFVRARLALVMILASSASAGCGASIVSYYRGTATGCRAVMQGYLVLERYDDKKQMAIRELLKSDAPAAARDMARHLEDYERARKVLDAGAMTCELAKAAGPVIEQASSAERRKKIDEWMVKLSVLVGEVTAALAGFGLQLPGAPSS